MMSAKRLLPIAGIVAALAVAALVAAVAFGGSSDDSGGSARPKDGGGDGPVAAMCAEGVTDCDDMVVEGGAGTCLEGATDCFDTDGGSMNMCIAEDDPGAGTAAQDCNDIVDGSRCAADAAPECQMLDEAPPGDPGVPSGPITASDPRIAFNQTVTQAHLDETVAVLTDIAPDTEFLIQESFPPVGVARVTTSMASFCPDIEAKFESLSYVSDVTCVESRTDPVRPSDPDEPASSRPGNPPDSIGE